MKKSLIKKQFGDNASKYVTSDVHAKGWSLTRLLELVQPQDSWRVLDIATAAGHTAFTLAPHVAHVLATDITLEMLQKAKELAKQKGIDNVSFQEADAEDLPFADDSFDLVSCRLAAHHFPNIDRFMAQAKRVLRLGGILALVDNVTPADPEVCEHVNAFERLRDPSHERCLTINQWRKLFETTGLTVVHIEATPKEMDFSEYTERMNVEPKRATRLRELLLNASPSATEFFQPRQVENKIVFCLTEAIIIGRRN